MTLFDRRRFLAGSATLPLLAGCVASGVAEAQDGAGFVTRPIRGVELPVVGIGTARRYSDPATEEDWATLRATVARFAELGGRVIDMAPSYGKAEEVVGRIVGELGLRDRLYLATKVDGADPAASRAVLDRSFAALRTDYIDLIAVHNLRDVANSLALLRDLRAAKRIGALGITTSFDPQYEDFARVLRTEEMDTIQVDYALDNRNAAEAILPLARDRGVAPMINLPFGRSRLFEAVAGKELPGWAAEIGAASWAQVFLKYVVSHPSRPIAIPGMARVAYVDDNLGAARGAMPDEAMRRRMEAYFDAL
ncbi:aldo/keto reductase [Tsuneonella sp. HG222]